MSDKKTIIDEVIKQLVAQEIDLYLIITSEHADHMTSFVPGVDTVGAGAFAFTKEGKKVAFASVIDAQDVEESELFDEVIKYSNYDEQLAQFVQEVNPKRVALNFSEKYAICDGLTVGRYNKFKESLSKDICFEEVSSDLFMISIIDANKN